MSALIRLYPHAWRERYEPEFLALLEVRPPSVRDRIDIIRGAIDARLDSGAPRESDRHTRIAAGSAIAAGVLWIMWLLMSMEAFDPADGESVRDVGRIVSLFAGLAALASHLSLGIVSLDRMRGWGGWASGIAALGFALTLFGGGAAAFVALAGSIGLATAVAGPNHPNHRRGAVGPRDRRGLRCVERFGAYAVDRRDGPLSGSAVRARLDPHRDDDRHAWCAGTRLGWRASRLGGVTCRVPRRRRSLMLA